MRLVKWLFWSSIKKGISGLDSLGMRWRQEQGGQLLFRRLKADRGQRRRRSLDRSRRMTIKVLKWQKRGINRRWLLHNFGPVYIYEFWSLYNWQKFFSFHRPGYYCQNLGYQIKRATLNLWIDQLEMGAAFSTLLILLPLNLQFARQFVFGVNSGATYTD